MASEALEKVREAFRGSLVEVLATREGCAAASLAAVGLGWLYWSKAKTRARPSRDGDEPAGGEGADAATLGHKRLPRGKGDLALRADNATKPALSYIGLFVEAMADLYAANNPQGFIGKSVQTKQT